MEQEKDIDPSTFSGREHVKVYSAYRKGYPKEVFSMIKELCSKSDRIAYDLAIDAGCGTGQSTFGLCEHFKRVIGIDASANQILEAQSKNIYGAEFKCGRAEDLSFLDSGSVDLVTVATALHWMDIKVFFEEVIRVLKPGGIIIIYAYYNLKKWKVDVQEAQTLLLEYRENILEPYISEKYRKNMNQFEDYPLPMKNTERIDFSITEEFTVDEVIGRLESSSLWQQHKKDHPNTTVLHTLRNRFEELYTDKESGKVNKVKLDRPIFFLVGKKDLIK